MATSSPPASSPEAPQRPLSALYGMQRSSSRLSISSKQGGSRFSDDDARTSVKVAVRVRPPLRPSDPGYELIPQRFQRSLLQAISATSLAIDSPQGRKLYVFDRVFGESVNQEGIWDYVNESVEAFVQGYNVSVLAYGQSGSGKSYTMGTSGPAEQSDPRIMGVIPRAAEVLFQKLQGPPALKRTGSSVLRAPTRYSMSSPQTSSQSIMTMAKLAADKNWQMKATYVEIYNEQLRDLLVPESVPQNERATVAIREDTRGRILLTGLHQININSVEDLLGALNFGSSIRQTDATAINAKSSRSHAVFSISLIQRKTSQTTKQEKRFSVPLEAMSGSENWITVDSKLHFVDLAGSERLKNTQASGERAREGISINAGLASLGKVISQLSSRQAGSHVSYRDSKLTRLLQDSLGGNAITYMIACVTPAEFHLSETLNTVQYALRARAIQSKPEIQQVSDDSDKQAVIDRLRAEVSFLRDQISNSDRSDRRGEPSSDRIDRQNEREIELQNHLLDVQENYTALSQRHAKLISEITKARDDESHATPALTEAIGNSAVERLKRSNSFAEAVEQVVLEYEKTIQSLESSLSKTRSSLSTTESSLLERESKIAYVETLNQQLQSQVRKISDREANTSKYLHDLEARLDGQASGEEKSSAVVTELRKEIARIRENESSCEEYITTLEERLAETDQDMELMQREVDRLEHVVERQRSIGKLDNLLHEFDNIQQSGNPHEQTHSGKSLTNGFVKPAASHNDQRSVLQEAVGTAIPESDSEEFEDGPMANMRKRGLSDLDESFEEDDAPKINGIVPEQKEVDRPRSSRAQSQFVAEKLETVNQELFELRNQHESTLTEYDLMSAKYEEALRTLAELQDAADEARHPAPQQTAASPASTRRTSFLGDARVNELKNGGQPPSSRSLSSELSLAADSNTSPDQSLDGSPIKKRPSSGPLSHQTSRSDHSLRKEIEFLRRSQEEKDDAMMTLKDRYTELQDVHAETLDVVEGLKTEIQKSRMRGPNSPTKASSMVRRKGSQNILMLDRAHRSLASLKNIAAENFEDKPDTMQNFELNLSTTMQELHERAERVQVLEGELAKVKKEMDAKSAMISGLTRERSSLKSTSPIDISVVSSIHEQLMQNEGQVKTLQETHAAREQELLSEIESLQRSLDVKIQTSKTAMPGFFPETPAILDNSQSTAKQLGEAAVSPDVSKLQDEVAEWQGKHQAVLASMQASEQKFLNTISELETSMATIGLSQSREAKEQAAADIESRRSEHAQTVESLQRELDEHKATIGSHQDKLAELERSQVSAREQLDEHARYKALTEAQLEGHRSQMASLERKVVEHQSDVEFHKHGLRSLHDSHSKELETVQTRLRVKLAEEADARAAEMARAHEKQVGGQKAEFEESMRTTNSQLIEVVESRDHLANDLRILKQEHQDLTDRMMRGEGDLKQQAEELDKANNRTKELSSALTEATAALEDYKKLADQKSAELERVVSEKEKAVRLVDELEDQLSATYDQHRATSSRLSVLSSGRDQALQEAHFARSKLEEEVELYRNKLNQAELERSTSPDFQTRKANSAISLPSPPPAIPLPPLPTMASASNVSLPNGATANSPGPEFAFSQQHFEDQEGRIRTIEKHLFAEKQLTATLEEALVDLESQGNKIKIDMESWKKKAWALEDELGQLKRERGRMRDSVQAVEEEREARKEAERAKERLEERMRGMEGKRKKKGGGFNCF